MGKFSEVSERRKHILSMKLGIFFSLKSFQNGSEYHDNKSASEILDAIVRQLGSLVLQVPPPDSYDWLLSVHVVC